MANQPKTPEPQDQTDENGQGQSGYAAGRVADDPSLKFRNRNQVKPPGKESDAEPALGTDDRFTGRGGEETARKGVRSNPIAGSRVRSDKARASAHAETSCLLPGGDGGTRQDE